MSDLKLAKIIPEGKRILVQLNSIGECKTKGGVILPALHSEEFRIGFILAKGEGVESFEVGDKVLVGWTFGESIHFPDQDILDDTLRVGTQNEIWAKIKE